MKRIMQLAMIAIGVLLLTDTQVLAHDLDLEADMGEGITLPGKETNTVRYKYDSIKSGSQESMTEAVFFPEARQDNHHFAGDPSMPPAEALMAEGICLKTFSRLIATQ